MAAALVVAVAVLAVQYRDVSSLVRGHRDARHLITPTNYLTSLFKISRDAVAAPPGERQPIGAGRASRRPGGLGPQADAAGAGHR